MAHVEERGQSFGVRLDPSLLGTFAERAAGRALVIDAFRSWQCGTWIGDLTAEWWRTAPDDPFVALTPLEGVPVYAHRRLVRLLEAAGACVVRSRLAFLGRLRLTLDRPELWIDYLDRPVAWAPRRDDASPTP